MENELFPQANINISSDKLAALNFLLWPLVLYTIIWAGINTGPWVFRRMPASLLGWIHYIRTALPLLISLALPFLVIHNLQSSSDSHPKPVYAWLLYGLAGLLACSVSPRPSQALYWVVCFFSVFVPVFLCIQGDIKKIVYLNQAGWIITATILGIMVFFARDALFVDYRGQMTGYGVINRVGTVADVGMSRSSGMARFAAVPGVVAFVYLIGQKNVQRLLWLVPFLASCALVWLMQSRGAIAALAFSLSLIMLFFSLRIRLAGITLMVAVALLYWSGGISEHTISYAQKHLARGQTAEQLRSMTGRTHSWKKAWREIKKSPVIGWGPQSDRYLTKEHVHNTYLYALLQGGFLGAAFFVGGLLWAWWLFAKAILKKTADALGQRPFLIQVGGVLAFFTIRSIPEVCGAMFGVDLMVMLPALAYLGALDQQNLSS